MRAGYRKFFMFAQVATLIGIGYLMTRFWEDAKKQCELYNLPQKLWVIFGIMFICGIVSWGRRLTIPGRRSMINGIILMETAVWKKAGS